MSSLELVIATTNENKLLEIRSQLPLAGLNLLSLRDFDGILEAPETGSDFADIAKQKAEFYYRRLQKPVLAEDSGLVIPALGDFPGIYSARIGASDPERISAVLQKLANSEDRRGYYVCNMALIVNGIVRQVEARCDGRITLEPRGHLGFGYDPIFVPDGSEKTFAEMSRDEKSKLSHRGKTTRLILPHLLNALL